MEETLAHLRCFRPSSDVKVGQIKKWLLLTSTAPKGISSDSLAWAVWARYCAVEPASWLRIGRKIATGKEKARSYVELALYCLRDPGVRDVIGDSDDLMPGSRLWRAIFIQDAEMRWDYPPRQAGTFRSWA
jgi:hypothetical protein